MCVSGPKIAKKWNYEQHDFLCKNCAEFDAEFVFVEKVAKLLCEKSDLKWLFLLLLLCAKVFFGIYIFFCYNVSPFFWMHSNSAEKCLLLLGIMLILTPIAHDRESVDVWTREATLFSENKKA